ncbi:MAG: hypothetical protein CVV27_05165 [Candidatus Melainabacteria bacterium HGW-Melainabacteria-1]|nr:MAG: hypothetical protein CVV27_05165 [Candidatus Melainabacteria bacterium HGW-Melainabacteria-1]
MVKRATNRWSVQAEGEKTLLTSEATVELKGGIFGRLLEPIMAPIMRSMGPKAFAGFKYLVENGKPYEGPADELPVPLAVC